MIFQFTFFNLLKSQNINDNSSFYDKILTNVARDNHFIIINVANKKDSGQYAVAIDDLYWYLHQARKINKKEFQLMVKKKLIDNDTFNFKSHVLSDFSFRKTPKINKIANWKFKDKRKLIEKYFYPEEFNFKQNVTIEEQNALIAKLFSWKIPTHIQSYSGLVMVLDSYEQIF